MTTCPWCGAGVGHGDEVCHECGRRVSGESDRGDRPDNPQPPVDEVGPGSPAETDTVPGHPEEPGGGSGRDWHPIERGEGGPAGPAGRSGPSQSEGYTAGVEPASRFTGRFMTGVSVVTALIAVFFLPPVFGGISIYAGYRVYRQYDRTLGKLLVAAGVGATAIGMLVGVLVLAG